MQKEECYEKIIIKEGAPSEWVMGEASLRGWSLMQRLEDAVTLQQREAPSTT